MPSLLQAFVLGSCRRGLDAQEGEARVHVSASCLCERSNKAGARCRQPEADSRHSVKKTRTKPQGEAVDDDTFKLS